MVRFGKSAIIVAALATASTLNLTQPAQANDIRSFVDQLIGTAAGQWNFDARRAELDARITQNLRAGRLTSGAAADLQAELDRITQLQADFKADGALSLSESATLRADLNKLSARIDSMLSASAVSGSDVDTRRADLEAKISQGLASGTLTASEASHLRMELSRIREMQVNMRANAETLMRELDRVDAQIAVQMRDRDVVSVRPGTIDSMQAEIDAKISAGLVSGRLTAEEAEDLRDEYDRLLKLEARFKASGGFLSPGEERVLRQGLDRLMARVHVEEGDTQIAFREIDQRIANLQTRIEDAFGTGKITRREYDTLKAEMDHVIDWKSQALASGDVLTEEERQHLIADLDRVSSRLNEMAGAGPAPPLTGNLDARKAELLTRINRGVASGRLTRAEAAMLRREYDRIARLEAEFRLSGRFLDRWERTRLSNELDGLATLVWKEMNDRETAQRGWMR